MTPKGAATRARIVDAANQLMYERGVAATTLADVRAASATSKSQVYQHFADKDALVKEVIETRAEDVLTQQRRRLRRVESLRGFELWRDELVERNALRNGAYGCPLGSLANEIADHNEDARRAIAAHFDEWLEMLIDAVERLKTRGVLRSDADSRALASGLLSALQGVLSSGEGEPRHLSDACCSRHGYRTAQGLRDRDRLLNLIPLHRERGQPRKAEEESFTGVDDRRQHMAARVAAYDQPRSVRIHD